VKISFYKHRAKIGADAGGIFQTAYDIQRKCPKLKEYLSKT